MIRDPLPHDEFKNHFEKLSSENAELSPFQQSIVKILEQLKNNIISNPLNNESSIKSCEIIKAIKSLKNCILKSSSVDLISNEMLKNAIPSILDPLTKLFNFIFNKGNKSWSESILVPLHKKVSKADPNNYRGISVTSNLGKVFNKIIHERLMSFVKNNNLISKNQIGFMEKNQTADIFTLKSIIYSYKSKTKKVFACFIGGPTYNPTVRQSDSPTVR